MSKFKIPTQAVPTVQSAYAEVIGNTESQIIEIQNELIVENNKQPFLIHDDTIDELAERIKQDGQLSPCLVSPLPDGKYELIDGRHRRRAVIKAGLSTTKCIVLKNLTERQKVTYRITLNLARNNDYLPSERAFSLKELVELEGGNDAVKQIAEVTNTNRKKVYRYIRLTYLIKPLLDRVDNGSIPMIAAVELSFLTEQEQKKLFEFLLNHPDCKITTTNASEIKKHPDNLDEIFYPLKQNVVSEDISEYDEQDGEENVDNLSTEDTATENSMTSSSEIEEDVAMLISFILLGLFKDLFAYIVRDLYSTDEVCKYIKAQYKMKAAGLFEIGNDFYIPKYIGKSYFFSLSATSFTLVCEKQYEVKYKELDKYLRKYISQHCDKAKIIALFNSDESIDEELFYDELETELLEDGDMSNDE